MVPVLFLQYILNLPKRKASIQRTNQLIYVVPKVSLIRRLRCFIIRMYSYHWTYLVSWSTSYVHVSSFVYVGLCHACSDGHCFGLCVVSVMKEERLAVDMFCFDATINISLSPMERSEVYVTCTLYSVHMYTCTLYNVHMYTCAHIHMYTCTHVHCTVYSTCVHRVFY